MKMLWQIMKGFFLLFYLVFIIYITWSYDALTSEFGLSPYLIPIIIVPSVLAIGFKFIFLYYRTEQMEYEFTSIVNHTFRTPLTRIMWYSKELEKDLPTNERALYVQDIVNATTRILDIVDLFAGIKNINDRSGYFFQATSIRDIIEHTIVKYRSEINKRGLLFDMSTFKDAPMLTLDLKKITFVIDALIENAIFYTPKGGKITIDYKIDGKVLTLYVRDTGMGFAGMERFRVFNRFYRSKRAILMNPDGMGLKLYLSKKIIRRHHGKIYATSKGKDMGATFYMELPL
ncbi:MAG: sensor histidine kinase [Candidatus Paceibacteria bacterium]